MISFSGSSGKTQIRPRRGTVSSRFQSGMLDDARWFLAGEISQDEVLVAARRRMDARSAGPPRRPARSLPRDHSVQRPHH